MGCILRDFDYAPPPNVPPSVHPTWPRLGTVFQIDLEGPETSFTFQAVVRDANLDQPLKYLAYLDRSPDTQAVPFASGNIEPDTDEDRLNRVVEFSIDKALFTETDCYVVELLVTGDFADFPPQPVDPDDVGTGVWFISTVNSADVTNSMDECPFLMRSEP